MKLFINLAALILSLTLSYSSLSKSKNAADQSNKGIVDRYYVGSDISCGYTSIQAAIDAASNSQNSTEVRIARNMGYFENLQIDTSNILIDGSYANCADARNNIHIDGTTIINDESESGQVTIKITGLFVHIRGITLINNDQGGIFADQTSVITLEDMRFSQLGTHALHITGNGQIVVRIKNTGFLNNNGVNGSAINCEPTSLNSNHSIEISENSSFVNNSTSSHGGALYLGVLGTDRGCEFSMLDGIFSNNISAGFGGAIIAFNSNMVFKNVILDSNEASISGGAIHLESDTILNAESVQFINNQSGFFGGAINATNIEINIKATAENCSNTNKCNFFDNNRANDGGAISANNSSIVNISSTFFENNRANFGTAIFSQSGSSMKIEGSVFTNNGNQAAGGFEDRNVILTQDNSNTTISYSTFADNKVLFSTFKQEDNAILNIYSSIIYDLTSGPIFESIGDNTTLDTDCLIVHEDDSFDTTNAEISVAVPLFVDPVNGDFHIDAAISPAIDYCTDAIAMAQFKDIDFQDRGFDDTAIPNNIGPYDIGADETYGNDIIFKNSFE